MYNKTTRFLLILSFMFFPFIQTKATLIDDVKTGRFAEVQYILCHWHIHNLDKPIKDYVNQKDSDGKTALHYAINLPETDESIDILNFLLDNQASPNIVDNGQQTPLTLALAAKKLIFAGILIHSGVGISLYFNFATNQRTITDTYTGRIFELTQKESERLNQILSILNKRENTSLQFNSQVIPKLLNLNG